MLRIIPKHTHIMDKERLYLMHENYLVIITKYIFLCLQMFISHLMLTIYNTRNIYTISHDNFNPLS